MATLPKTSIETAAVSWLDGGGQIHLRVYSSDGYTVTERCWDGSGWYDGGFTPKGENVAATAWTTSDANIRVYCTYQGKVSEWCWDAGGSGWYQGAYTLS